MRTLAGLALAVAFSAAAHAEAPPASAADTIVVAERGSHSIAGLLQHRSTNKQFRHGIAIFPGYPGILRLREEEGRPVFNLGGNFLVRSRRHWLDDETLVLVVDAPSDTWGTFSQLFRETPRYGADVAALLAEVGRRHPVGEWTFVGTSEGSVSAFHAARMNPELAKRVILTASVFRWGKNGPGLSDVSFDQLKMPLLWVHHADDPCNFTRYRDAREFAQKSGAPLLTVRGGEGTRGDACEAFTAHGFVGMEKETVTTMRQWVKTGQVPAEIAR